MPPRKEEDLVIAASNSRVLGFDNISRLTPDMADALCCLATGMGFATCTLYTNAEETIFCAKRPVLVNGIEEFVQRPDLLERCLVLHLPPIPDARRRGDVEIREGLARAAPHVLGAVLDAVASALRHYDATRPAGLPRMADFARWATAAEPGLGWPAGTVIDAMRDNREAASLGAIEADAVAAAVFRFAMLGRTWDGPVSLYMDELAALGLDGDGWPRTSHHFSQRLRRSERALAYARVRLVLPPRTRHGQAVRVERVANDAGASVTGVTGPTSVTPPSTSPSPPRDTGDAPAPPSVTVAEGERDARDARSAPAAGAPTTLVRVVQRTGPFVGPDDLAVYDLRPGDEVRLPDLLADVLVRRGVAQRVVG